MGDPEKGLSEGQLKNPLMVLGSLENRKLKLEPESEDESGGFISYFPSPSINYTQSMVIYQQGLCMRNRKICPWGIQSVLLQFPPVHHRKSLLLLKQRLPLMRWGLGL